MITLENVCVTLGGSKILKDVDLRIEKGETGVILGSSGSGKTTILRVILGLVKPDCGSVQVNGDDVTAVDDAGLYKIREKIGMVFQGGALFDSLTVGENVGYRLKELRDMESEAIEEAVRKSLRFVGLEEAIDLMPAELSGGMKKRVAIARGIASSPTILLYDEPTTGLDPVNSFNINTLINRLRVEEGVTSVVVTHDLPSAFMVATKVAFLHEGIVAYSGKIDGLLKSRDEKALEFMRHSSCLTAYTGADGPAGAGHEGRNIA